MSKKISIKEIKELLKQDYAKLDEEQVYKNRHTKLDYVCRYGEKHHITMAAWKSGRRCACYKKWERILAEFNIASNIIESNSGKITCNVSCYKNAHSPITFINCSGKEVKMSTNNLKLCLKAEKFKEEIIAFYTSDKKLSDVVAYFKLPIIPMALRLWGHSNSDSNRFIRFKVPAKDVYIEVKGRFNKMALKKVELLREQGYTVLLWDAEELLKRGIINNSGRTELNRKYRSKELYKSLY